MKKKIIIIASIAVACIIACVCDYAANRTENENKTVNSSQSKLSEANETSVAENFNTSNQPETLKESSKFSNSQTSKKNETERESKTNAPTKPHTEKQTQSTSKANSATLTISCKNAIKYSDKALVPSSGYFVNSESFEFSDGETVYSALSSICKKNNISLVTKGNYISGIGGLNEKDCTNSSGWVYTVNGELARKPMNKQILKNGDKIEIYYVTSPTDKA